MALVLRDRVKETTITAGTGTITLAGAVAGFQSFSAIGNGNSTYYVITDPATGDWEVGIGTYTSSGTTLSRTTVLSSSNAGSLVPFAAGIKEVFVSYPSSRAVYQNEGGTATVQNEFNTLNATTANITTANITAGTVSTTPTSGTDIANKTYVDTMVSSGITYHAPVRFEAPNALTATYNNGTAGVGATLTNAGTLGAFTPDGVVASVNDRVLIYQQANAVQNGVYTVTTVGDGSTPWVLTRATDANTYGIKTPNGLGEGDAFFVTSGNTGAGETYVCNTQGTITFGTTNITFVQVSSAQIYSAGTGLTLSGTQFSITNTGVSANTYGSASAVPVFIVNSQGQITSVTNTNIAISGSAVSGNISGQAGSVANALTAGTFLTSGGTYDGSAARTFAVDATSANTASKVVARDASGNFSAGTITATLSGAATSATTATNLAGGAANQLAYQTATNTTGFTAAPTASGELLNWNGSAYAWTLTPTISSITLSGGTANGVAYLNGSKVLTTGSALTFDGTNLGVGTNNPSAYGTVAVNGASAGVHVNATTGVASFKLYEGAGSGRGAITSLNGSDGLAFLQGTTEGMRLTSTGLGIGTSSPGYKLDVRGSAGNIASWSDGSNPGTLYSGGGYVGLTFPAALGGFFINTAGNFNTISTNGIERVRVDASGNLGIGTSSPATLLDLRTSNGVSAILRLGSSSSVGNTTVGTIEFYDADADDAGIKSSISNVITGNVGPGGAQGGNLLFSTATSGATPTERMRLDSSGNLGLGVTPSAWGFRTALQIGSGGSLAAFNGGASFASNIEISGNSFLNASASRRYIASDFATLYRQEGGIHSWLTAPSGTAGNAISFTQAMTLDASGNLGVGTTSPSARLHVSGTSNYPALITNTGTSAALLNFVNNTTNSLFIGVDSSSGGALTGTAYAAAFWYQSNYPMVFATNNTERARITSAGAWSFGSSGTNTGTSGQVLTSQGSGAAPTWADGLSASTDNTFTGTQTFTGTSSKLAMVLNDAAETTTVSATAATGTINFDVTTQSVLYYTSNASANWTLNVRASSGTTLNTIMSTGQSVTIAFLVTNGSTAYRQTGFQIDGSNVTPRWQGGTAPSSGNANSIDAYSITIIKTGAATFTALESQTRFA